MSEASTKPGADAARNYKSTLRLPKTKFPMKANLVQNEPASLKRWKQAKLYERVREVRAGREPYVFHDGPPYANGSIHLGHLMNKCLKDFVVRSRSMAGYDTPYVPGWDCHGLPIEHKVVTEMVASGDADKLAGLTDDERRMAVRRACKKYAEKHQKLQAGQMERLLTLADYSNAYMTMQPEYESAVLDVLATLLERGLVYRALKPVHWSIANETALADAELEYENREDLSVYVDFESADGDAVYRAFGLDEDAVEERGLGASPSFMIWTTTPWTLPANMAIAVNPEVRYALVKIDGNLTVLAEGRVEAVTKASEEVDVIASAEGGALLGLRYRHPFRDEPAMPGEAVWSVVAADYVTTEDGTGLVHTASGHGVEDYQTSLKVGLPVYCPVLGDGTYDETVPGWLRGMSVWDANEEITKRLGQSGHLFNSSRFMHSYPHDWRSKTPVIFRSTEQWFVSVDSGFEVPGAASGGSLRERALDAIGPDATDAVGFIPSWGRNRFRGMLESRPDWCISRQRAWGLPIPSFRTPAGETFMTPASVRAVAALVRERGSDVWFKAMPSDLLAGYDPSSDPDAPAGLDVSTLEKNHDILDVWFEAGSSWNAVQRQRFGDDGFPADLYLEGSDQHRGWFQLSLLPSLGVTGKPPFRAILTHGFMVDKDGRKLSKSRGHTIENLFERYGADVLRWWVSSLAYEGDVKVDDEFFDQAGESYRKVRNTLRFMLSNLGGEDLATEQAAAMLRAAPPTSLEAWLCHRFDALQAQVRRAYDRCEFRAAHLALYQFCADTLSSVYLAATKDRLYCDPAESERRQQSVAAMRYLADGLCRLIAPVLCHTADEAFRVLHGDDACVHVEEMLEPIGARAHDGFEQVMRWRDDALQAIEHTRAASKGRDNALENPLDMGLVAGPRGGLLAEFDATDLADLTGVSRVELSNEGSGIEVRDLRGEPRCERSWKRDGTVRERSDGGMLTDRDAAAVGVA